MKKFYFSLGKWFISTGVVLLPVGAWATNEIQMESYFPTPYVTYNNVFVSQQFDVGTSKGPFTLSLGSNRGNPTPSLQIAPIPFGNNALVPDDTANAFAHLKTTPEGGPTLSFGNVQMRSRDVRFGSPTDQVDNAEMTFGNLRIVTLSNMKAKPVQEINATSVQVDKQMYLMEDRFANAALPGCEKTVSWQKLALGNESDAWYLVCGNPVEGGGTPPEECPSWKWEWVANISRCSTPTDKYLEAYIQTQASSQSSTELLSLVLPYSSCVTIRGTWSASAGHPWFMPVDPEYGGSTSSWCTVNDNYYAHDPGKGKMCLDVGISRNSAGQYSNYKMPACKNVNDPNNSYSTDDFGETVMCETTVQPEINWYSGPSSPDNDVVPLFRMYHAVCAD